MPTLIEAPNGKTVNIHFYYVRNYDNAPIITLCTLRDVNTHELQSLGVAVCSPRDMPNKKVGKLISCGRAMKNLHNGVLFNQQPLKNVKVLTDVLLQNYWVDYYTGENNIPPYVNTFMELLEFDLDTLADDPTWRV